MTYFHILTKYVKARKEMSMCHPGYSFSLPGLAGLCLSCSAVQCSALSCPGLACRVQEYIAFVCPLLSRNLLPSLLSALPCPSCLPICSVLLCPLTLPTLLSALPSPCLKPRPALPCLALPCPISTSQSPFQSAHCPAMTSTISAPPSPAMQFTPSALLFFQFSALHCQVSRHVILRLLLCSCLFSVLCCAFYRLDLSFSSVETALPMPCLLLSLLPFT